MVKESLNQATLEKEVLESEKEGLSSALSKVSLQGTCCDLLPNGPQGSDRPLAAGIPSLFPSVFLFMPSLLTSSPFLVEQNLISMLCIS